MDLEYKLKTRYSGSNLQGTGDVRNCYGIVKLLEHGMKVVERVLEKGFCRIVAVDELQFCLMPERGTIDAMFISRRLHK